jgi:hypothetical protein
MKAEFVAGLSSHPRPFVCSISLWEIPHELHQQNILMWWTLTVVDGQHAIIVEFMSWCTC